ncbi:MAG: hypothetical protein S4CHLAM45_04690 [Chlamydiales bacterium]|nr:hypothetical protein [Chlamydiales bacterium]MCH9619321.1 hypothetical protein [Chlamydiales bacterium]MCH9622583.1 hypothetical protein [Chlamydiales bacterium]
MVGPTEYLGIEIDPRNGRIMRSIDQIERLKTDYIVSVVVSVILLTMFSGLVGGVLTSSPPLAEGKLIIGIGYGVGLPTLVWFALASRYLLKDAENEFKRTGGYLPE